MRSAKFLIKGEERRIGEGGNEAGGGGKCFRAAAGDRRGNGGVRLQVAPHSFTPTGDERRIQSPRSSSAAPSWESGSYCEDDARMLMSPHTFLCVNYKKGKK